MFLLLATLLGCSGDPEVAGCDHGRQDAAALNAGDAAVAYTWCALDRIVSDDGYVEAYQRCFAAVADIELGSLNCGAL